MAFSLKKFSVFVVLIITISNARASPRVFSQEIDLFYPFSDEGGEDNVGDYESQINDSNPQIVKELNFYLPFFGVVYNYTFVSLHGFLSFNDGPSLAPTYPLVFPVPEYPDEADPAFIGPFYSKCKLGELQGDDIDNRLVGVYFRKEMNVMESSSPDVVELRERLITDIREGIEDAELFTPMHVVIVTWKNVTFSGGTIHARRTTNTFQLVFATDQARTYAMFNYKHLGWTSHTEAGGSSEDGTGGIPAFVGFNGGNGTGAFEYQPYSQTFNILRLLYDGNTNGHPGRHIFRIDSNVTTIEHVE